MVSAVLLVICGGEVRVAGQTQPGQSKTQSSGNAVGEGGCANDQRRGGTKHVIKRPGNERVRGKCAKTACHAECRSSKHDGLGEYGTGRIP